MNELKLGVSGARGVVGTGLTPETIIRLGAAFAAPRKGKTILVGGDTRPTGPMVRGALIASLAGAGCDVLDCGICPTPTILYAVKRRDVGGGVLVTASHNPIEWNALKFVSERGFFLGPEEGEELARRYREGGREWVPYDRVGRLAEGPDVVAEHLEGILGLDFIDEEKIRRRRWKVALDGVGAAGCRIGKELLRRLGCEVTAVHCEESPRFPRPPEPRPENLGDLARAVKESGAAVGFALDPDADRLSLVAAGGRALSEERTVAFAVDHLLSVRPGPVVVNLSTSLAVEDLAARYGVPFHRTPVGEAHVAAKMVEVGAAAGGEGNGGVMVPALHPMRDAAMGMALVLQAMTGHGMDLNEWDRRLPVYALRKAVVPADEWNRETLVSRLAGRFGTAEVDERDGIRLSWERKWVHVRPSNTEPVVRVFAEAPGEEEADELQAEAAEAVTGRARPRAGE
ncbi:MAG: phosphoglucosamine mutase [Candidatus Eisenbacteria bacterium]